MSRFEIVDGKKVMQGETVEVKGGSAGEGSASKSEADSESPAQDQGAGAGSAVVVGVSKSGKYHKKECRFYPSTESDMSEAEAVAKGYVCGSCCVKK